LVGGWVAFEIAEQRRAVSAAGLGEHAREEDSRHERTLH
jgi:hypothetical protein